jgi:hypothetical protein
VLILLEVALGLTLLGLVLAYFMRGRREAERVDITRRRVEAYMQTIRREGTNPELAAMSDDELRDLLLSGAHNLRQQSDRKWFLLLVGFVVAAIGALAVGSADGMRGFGITAAIGAVALYGLNEFMSRRMREPFIERGIDVERLRVE